jgi:threonine synthase
MFNSGSTPLIRARHLEKKFNIGRIYLKLEGTNPSGHMIDRIAELSVFNAKKKKFTQIMVYGKKNYFDAMNYFANQQNIKLIVINKTNSHEKTVQIAKELNAYLAIEDEQIELFKNIAFTKMTDELLLKTKYKIDHIYISESCHYITAEINKHIFKRFIEQVTEVEPKMILGCNDHQNQNDDYYLETQFISTNEKANMAKILRQSEQIKISSKDTLAFGAFYKDVLEGKIKKGNHVIILENAKTHIDVKRLIDFNKETKDQLIQMTTTWLADYQDSIQETKDAIENAIQNGFILTAQYEQKIEGICIIVNTGFDAFIPSYHLAYIATDPLSKGRGVGTELIQRAIDLTDGSLSLHVDLDNKSARRLYQKMGFKLSYYRMIYEQN